jgi:hypothetical protein
VARYSRSGGLIKRPPALPAAVHSNVTPPAGVTNDVGRKMTSGIGDGLCPTLLATKAGVSIPVARPFHSITSSAPLISEGVKVTPRVLAVFMLTNSSTFVTSWTGRSEGFSPSSMRPV